ncbi:DUF6428 family protein [Psychromarinibacter sp. C21-152]|uniref:DUF6428 family protein n=1 Tax=Psychromarinibacter sediminicola TaxID=3033385 RepID=A0AAE3NRR3_9RHOB|nr:DUF6428 family protein [Psychromarinibacter sediminicola]MDF0600851.1 DUF6428 family protein [Psychromarinibacter sediminicola]
MTDRPATLDAFLTTLRSADPNLPTRFRTPGGDLGAGFHITELKHADIESIDCGGRRSRFREAVVQVLDGRGPRAMPAGKMAAILARSLTEIPGLGDAPFAVECAPANRGLTRYRADVPRIEDGHLVIALSPEHAVCKPMADRAGCAPKTPCCA